MGKVVGIDLGTSYSCVAIVEEGEARVIRSKDGETIQPSVVSFQSDGKVLVGREAKKQIVLDPRNTIYSAKRLIGRKYFSEEVKKAQAACPYEIVEGPNADVRIRVAGRELSLPEVSSIVLKKMKKIAEDYLQEEVDRAVVTVPAYFNDGQRQATKDAGRIAGLEVLRIINEPTAAALAYGYGQGLQQKVVIYDLGGGTFDVSVLELGNDVFEVISTAGDTYLGGDDFDDRIMSFLADEFQKSSKIDITVNKEALQKLKNIAERTKWALSTKPDIKIQIPGLARTRDGKTLGLETVLTRNRFQEMTFDLVQRTFKVCDEALQNARLTINDIDAVVLVGGSTRIPAIKSAVEKYFYKEPKEGIDPDEVVALGAAIQASTLVESKKESLLLDVTPLSLGIATVGGLVRRLIDRNTPIPTEYSSIFTTTSDNQKTVKIAIFQGEGNKQAENELLGDFTLTGIRQAPRGGPQIEVTFEIDTDGIVNVSAVDLDTNEKQSITVTAYGGLSEEEISSLQGQSVDIAY